MTPEQIQQLRDLHEAESWCRSLERKVMYSLVTVWALVGFCAIAITVAAASGGLK